MIITPVEKRTVALHYKPVIVLDTEDSFSIYNANAERITAHVNDWDKNIFASVTKAKDGNIIAVMRDGSVLSSTEKQEFTLVDLKPLAKVGTDMGSMFHEINQWTNRLNSADRETMYRELDAILTMAVERQEFRKEYDECICQFYRFFNYQDMLALVEESQDLIHPETKENYGIEEPDNGITYITKDYLELSTLAIFLRPMALIWSVEMDTLPSEQASDKKREMIILKDSLRYDFLQLPAMERLDRYVSTLASDHSVSLGAIMDGLGSEDLKPWLMGFTLLRRVSLFQFSRTTDAVQVPLPANIVSNIYNFLIGKINTAITSFGTSFRLKRMKRAHGDGEKVASFGDNYKITDKVTEGTIAQYDRAAMDTMQYWNIEPSLDLEEMERRYKTNYDLFVREEIELQNYVLVQYVLDDVFPMRIIPSLSLKGEGRELVMLFTATQMILETWELHDLASLVFASSTQIPYNKTYDNVKSRMSFDLAQQLKELTPAVVIAEKGKDTVSESITAIEDLTSEWSSLLWNPYVSDVSKGKTTMKKLSNGFLIHKEIRNDLAKLLLKLIEGK